ARLVLINGQLAPTITIITVPYRTVLAGWCNREVGHHGCTDVFVRERGPGGERSRPDHRCSEPAARRAPSAARGATARGGLPAGPAGRRRAQERLATGRVCRVCPPP